MGIAEKAARMPESWKSRPGRLTVNDIGALCRAMPEEHASRMLGGIVEVFAL